MSKFKLEDLNFNPDGIAATYSSSRILSLNELVEYYEIISREHPDSYVISSLDDQGQAGYTEFHCISSYDLNSLDSINMEDIDIDKWRDSDDDAYINDESIPLDEKINYDFFSTPQMLPIRINNILSSPKILEFDKINCRWNIEEALFVGEKGAYDANIIDQRNNTYFQLAPVACAGELIAVSPQNYWASAMSPFDIYALAKHLEDNYGILLCAMGAEYMGFYSKENLDDDKLLALSKDLINLYGADDNRGKEQYIIDMIKDKKIFFLTHCTA